MDVRDRPSDPYLDQQWYLRDPRGIGVDIDVWEVWRDYSGAGVTVGIWDDGIDFAHPDLDGNYDGRLLGRIGGVRHDPAPKDPGSEHGTAVAGIIAAEADGSGTVGIAWGATFGGVDIFYDPTLDEDLSFRHLARFDVTNHSWGLVKSFGANMHDPSMADAFAAWGRSVVEGRDGLGTINVVSAGNDREALVDANHSNLANTPETIAVAAVGRDGVVSFYSTPGACLLVAAPSNGAAATGIWTTDRTGFDGYSDGYNEPGNNDPDYTADFGGTSAAAPVVSGVVALILEANPFLGWRDVQEILAVSARHTGGDIGGVLLGAEQSRWVVNGAETWNGGGLHFSNDYGFGLVDALAAVRLAETWRGQETSANWHREVLDWRGDREVPDAADRVRLGFDAAGGSRLDVVTLELTIADGYSGDYRVRLISPAGTRSLLSTSGELGDAVTDTWTYTSNAFRGEDGSGRWRLAVEDAWGGNEGRLRGAELTLLGSADTGDDVHVFTDEFFLASGFGATPVIRDRDGGFDTLNAAAVAALPSSIDLRAGTGLIDGVAIRLRGEFERVVTGDGDDRLRGDGVANTLEGWRGDDRLDGRGGGDLLRGGRGRDELVDGRGADRLAGGPGEDVFTLQPDGVDDWVVDFRQGADRVRLEGLRFGALELHDDAAVRIDYAGEHLFLRGTGPLAAEDLSAADFLFV